MGQCASQDMLTIQSTMLILANKGTLIYIKSIIQEGLVHFSFCAILL